MTGVGNLWDTKTDVVWFFYRAVFKWGRFNVTKHVLVGPIVVLLIQWLKHVLGVTVVTLALGGGRSDRGRHGGHISVDTVQLIKFLVI